VYGNEQFDGTITTKEYQPFKFFNRFVAFAQVDLLLTNPCWTLESKWFSVRCRIKLLAIIRSIVLLAVQVRDMGLYRLIDNNTSGSLLKDWCNYGCFPFLRHKSYRQQ